MNRLEQFLDQTALEKLSDLNNTHINNIVEWVVELCKPAKISIITDDENDIAYVRKLALDSGEECSLTINGHTIHYDGYRDQARDKAHTKVLLPEGKQLGRHINTIDRKEGLNEIFHFMD